MPDYYIPLLPDRTYHIFSRAIGKEKLFLENENYKFFLRKYKLHISPLADTLAYNLLPNHFHFLIKIKSLEDIKRHFSEVKSKNPLILKKFRNL